MMARLRLDLSLILVLTLFRFSSGVTVYDLGLLGAIPDGKSDSAEAMLKAWNFACDSLTPATIRVPSGKFFLSRLALNGPCKNSELTIQIDGTFEAPLSFEENVDWISFDHVEGLSLIGGTIDGRGASLWDCKAKGLHCPDGARSLVFTNSNNVSIRGLTSMNSELYHIAIDRCESVLALGLSISAPANSPNTDGIHVQDSTGVTILNATIGTGDDCISVGPGTSSLWIERVSCGPGHGISIGSLGKDPHEEGVQNVTVKTATFVGTLNGLRIKTWARASDGFVNGVVFQHAEMLNVENPIIITQNYCPDGRGCPDQSSGVKISQVSYSDIHGSSTTPMAVDFSCSPTNPCSGIGLENIKLTYENAPAEASCKNVEGSASGFVIPPSCL